MQHTYVQYKQYKRKFLLIAVSISLILALFFSIGDFTITRYLANIAIIGVTSYVSWITFIKPTTFKPDRQYEVERMLSYLSYTRQAASLISKYYSIEEIELMKDLFHQQRASIVRKLALIADDAQEKVDKTMAMKLMDLMKEAEEDPQG